MRDYYELFQYLCYEILINKLHFVVSQYIYFILTLAIVLKMLRARGKKDACT